MATSIQSSEILEDIPQRSGKRYVRVKFVCVDHDGGLQNYFVGPKSVPADFNVQSWITANGDKILFSLANQEEAAAKDISSVQDPLVYAQNPKWSSFKKISIVLLNWMMQEKDARIVIYLETLIRWVQLEISEGRMTVAQVASLLNTTTAKIAALNRRVDAILTDTGTFKQLLDKYDAEEGNL